MNRRSFISGLIRVGAFAAFDPHRVIFDMGRKLWLPDRRIVPLYESSGGPPIGAILCGQAYEGGPFIELGRVDYLDMLGLTMQVPSSLIPVEGIPIFRKFLNPTVDKIKLTPS